MLSISQVNSYLGHLARIDSTKTRPVLEITQSGLDAGYSWSKAKLTLSSDILGLADDDITKFAMGHEWGHWNQAASIVRLKEGLTLLREAITKVGRRFDSVKGELNKRTIFDDVMEGDINTFERLKSVNPFLDGADSVPKSIDDIQAWAGKRKEGLMQALNTEEGFEGFKNVYPSIISEKGVLNPGTVDARNANQYLDAFINYPNVFAFNRSIKGRREDDYAGEMLKLFDDYMNNLLERDANDRALRYLSSQSL